MDEGYEGARVPQQRGRDEHYVPACGLDAVEAVAIAVQGPALAVAPVAVVLDRDPELGKGQVHPGQAARIVLDPVLRDRVQAGQLQQHPDLRLRQRLRERVGQRDRPPGVDDAVVGASGDHRRDRATVHELRAQHGVEVGDGVGQRAAEQQVQRQPHR
ncbi:hypothetical protein [Pseudonocardia sp.]|uniref:hypothetical protein n=1 Tax=Pseudonocardia sp. TaxID=60912 RepID=UPI002620D817|nr:hypothetical protein [Pseudonocardia sp.]